jgi:hypothetical protein
LTGQAMRRLYQAKDRIEAQMLRDFLADQGIETTLLGDYLAGAAGELPANIFPEVWVVQDQDLAAAAQLLQSWRKGPPESAGGSTWTCANCGEVLESQFQVCWRCATPRKPS